MDCPIFLSRYSEPILLFIFIYLYKSADAMHVKNADKSIHLSITTRNQKMLWPNFWRETAQLLAPACARGRSYAVFPVLLPPLGPSPPTYGILYILALNVLTFCVSYLVIVPSYVASYPSYLCCKQGMG